MTVVFVASNPHPQASAVAFAAADPCNTPAIARDRYCSLTESGSPPARATICFAVFGLVNNLPNASAPIKAANKFNKTKYPYLLVGIYFY